MKQGHLLGLWSVTSEASLLQGNLLPSSHVYESRLVDPTGTYSDTGSGSTIYVVGATHALRVLLTFCCILLVPTVGLEILSVPLFGWVTVVSWHITLPKKKMCGYNTSHWPAAQRPPPPSYYINAVEEFPHLSRKGVGCRHDNAVRSVSRRGRDPNRREAEIRNCRLVPKLDILYSVDCLQDDLDPFFLGVRYLLPRVRHARKQVNNVRGLVRTA
ncbi:hypothetical protein B0F90DRAFT_168809 [Multifurca ochricompacta]|uniref:Uncharacterized protein n=1 Tax=Multifurca ochricompacta TaxID=376703 RepID=A0AAD4QN36_9AGAM|nr:hypothetical protein B0F90DRAFT_168809 [Multifurca ochricompacta]